MTKLIAHRGLSGMYLENTKLAFLTAGKNPFVDAIECDVRFTLDNRAVTFHDKSIKRLNGNQVYVSHTPYLLLSKYRLFDNNDHGYDKGYSVCRFVTYLKICKKYKKIAVIEIKSASKKQLDSLIKIISKRRYMNKVVFISNLQKILIYLRKRLPYVPMQLITRNPTKLKFAFCVKYNIDLSAYYKMLKESTIKEYHNVGLKVSAWTVNNIKHAQKLVEQDVDYVTSDYPFNLNA